MTDDQKMMLDELIADFRLMHKTENEYIQNLNEHWRNAELSDVQASVLADVWGRVFG